MPLSTPGCLVTTAERKTVDERSAKNRNEAAMRRRFIPAMIFRGRKGLKLLQFLDSSVDRSISQASARAVGQIDPLLRNHRKALRTFLV
jgi:hypothetical protein